jgi:hypothetical protein
VPRFEVLGSRVCIPFGASGERANDLRCLSRVGCLRIVHEVEKVWLRSRAFLGGCAPEYDVVESRGERVVFLRGWASLVLVLGVELAVLTEAF